MLKECDSQGAKPWPHERKVQDGLHVRPDRQGERNNRRCVVTHLARAGGCFPSASQGLRLKPANVPERSVCFGDV